MPPEIQYNLFSNRLFGEIYINQTISPSYATSIAQQLETAGIAYVGSLGGLGSLGSFGSTFDSYAGLAGCLLSAPACPKVVNATRNYNYTEDVYVQYTLNPLFQTFNNINLDSSVSSWGNAFTAALLRRALLRPGLPGGERDTDGLHPQQHDNGRKLRREGLPEHAPEHRARRGRPEPVVGSLFGLSGYYYSTTSSSNLLGGNNILHLQRDDRHHTTTRSTRSSTGCRTSTGWTSTSPTPRTTYGYNRLLYTYVDRFNNTVYMPVDVDFANTTLLTLNTSSAVNTLNVNQSADKHKRHPLLPQAERHPGAGAGRLKRLPLLRHQPELLQQLHADHRWQACWAPTPRSRRTAGAATTSGPRTAPSTRSDSGCVLANPLSTFGLGSLLEPPGRPNPSHSLETRRPRPSRS